MSDYDSMLEKELGELAPAQPSVRLAARIACELDQPPQTSTGTRSLHRALWASWSFTVAAAAAAAVAWWPAATTPDLVAPVAPAAELVTDGNVMVPIGTSNVLTDAQDEGIVVLEDGRPARRVRLHFVDTVRLRDAQGGADIAVSRPREEVRFVPVNLY